MVPEIWSATDKMLMKKWKFQKNEKKNLEMSSFYTSVPKIMIICYTVPEIWCMTDVVIFHFQPFFALLLQKQPEKWKLKKMKKMPRDIIILHKHTKNQDHMLYYSWDMARDGCNYWSFWAILTERIKDACDKDLYACGAFLDFKKAFDTVNHDIFLSKPVHYGIKGQVNNWFHSYLTQRVQFTSVNTFNSQLYLISHGVPQGSVLGPLLFIIFVYGLNKSIRHSQMLHFADDTNLLYINKSMKK